MFLLPLRILDSPTPHCREAIPSSQTSTSPSRRSPLGHWIPENMGFEKKKGLAGAGSASLKERDCHLYHCTVLSSKTLAGASVMSLGSWGEARTRELFLRLSEHWGPFTSHFCSLSDEGVEKKRPQLEVSMWNRCASSMHWMASEKTWGEACFSLNYWDGLHTQNAEVHFVRISLIHYHSFYCVFLFWIDGLFMLVSYVFNLQFDDF